MVSPMGKGVQTLYLQDKYSKHAITNKQAEYSGSFLLEC